ncbi:Uncharacterised protein r2_g706 [Pycnogonum litorale]
MFSVIGKSTADLSENAHRRPSTTSNHTDDYQLADVSRASNSSSTTNLNQSVTLETILHVYDRNGTNRDGAGRTLKVTGRGRYGGIELVEAPNLATSPDMTVTPKITTPEQVPFYFPDNLPFYNPPMSSVPETVPDVTEDAENVGNVTRGEEESFENVTNVGITAKSTPRLLAVELETDDDVVNATDDFIIRLTTGNANETSAESENETTAESENETTAVSMNETTAGSENEKTTGSENETTAVSMNDATTGSENEKTTGSENEKTTGSEDEITVETRNFTRISSEGDLMESESTVVKETIKQTTNVSTKFRNVTPSTPTSTTETIDDIFSVRPANSTKFCLWKGDLKCVSTLRLLCYGEGRIDCNNYRDGKYNGSSMLTVTHLDFRTTGPTVLKAGSNISCSQSGDIRCTSLPTFDVCSGSSSLSCYKKSTDDKWENWEIYVLGAIGAFLFCLIVATVYISIKKWKASRIHPHNSAAIMVHSS